jgi:hypothetical protein
MTPGRSGSHPELTDHGAAARIAALLAAAQRKEKGPAAIVTPAGPATEGHWHVRPTVAA